MRPGQNKRIRGRNNSNNRKGPNPLTRSFESNGPDVKIRGTAHHIGEKYLQLARDAHSSGDPVRAESYLQHAEHYFRVIAAAQQAQLGYSRPYGEQADLDDDDDGDDGNMPDRFASPSERVSQQGVPERQGYQGGNGGERRDAHSHGQSERGQGERGQGERSYDNRNGRSYDNRGSQDRGNQDRGNQDRAYQDRGYHNQGHSGFGQAAASHNQNGQGHAQAAQHQAAQHQSAQGQGTGPQGQGGAAGTGGQAGGGQGGSSYDRNAGQRGDGERGGQQDRSPQHSSQQERGARDHGREQGRDYDNRQRGPRPFRPPAEDRQPDGSMNGLPAFITAPSRINVEPATQQPEPAEPIAAHAEIGEETVHLRPRRRRRSKADFADRSGASTHEDEGHQPSQPESAILPDTVGE